MKMIYDRIISKTPVNIDTMRNQAGEVLQYFGKIPYKLKAPFDFSFIEQYGKVFKVFDDQDSGNICFGTEKDGERCFIKFAGAPTERGSVTGDVAIKNLKATVPIYQTLRHKNLIELIGSEEVGGGFAMIFKWADGECMGRQYPASHKKFMSADRSTRLAVYRDILSFFEYTASQGYVAIDFYDSSVMYDFDSGVTTICDIDFFRESPCKNEMGRMWGSSRFMSPEEFEFGATIDEITNIYTVGAMAFALFADYSRQKDGWTLSEATYAVVTKAVNGDKSERQQSIREFINEWEEALTDCE